MHSTAALITRSRVSTSPSPAFCSRRRARSALVRSGLIVTVPTLGVPSRPERPLWRGTDTLGHEEIGGDPLAASGAMVLTSTPRLHRVRRASLRWIASEVPVPNSPAPRSTNTLRIGAPAVSVAPSATRHCSALRPTCEHSCPVSLWAYSDRFQTRLAFPERISSRSSDGIEWNCVSTTCRERGQEVTGCG